MKFYILIFLYSNLSKNRDEILYSKEALLEFFFVHC